MSNQEMSVTVTGMQRAEGAFEAALSNARTSLNAVQAEVATLGVAWTGEAAARFNQSLQRWCGEYQNINVQLSTILEALRSSRQAFAANERAAIDAAAGAVRGLEGL